jgi:tetratricopeptide (TPR) repeat protein
MGLDDQAQADMLKSCDLFEQIHNLYIEFPLYLLGVLEGKKGNYDRASQHFQEILLIGQRRGNDVTLSMGLVYLGMLAMAQDHFDEAEHWFNESISINRERRMVGEVLWISLWHLANLAWARGEFLRAEELFSEVLSIGIERADKDVKADARFGLGRVAFAQGRYGQAREYLLEALDMRPRYNKFNRGGIPKTLEALAFVEIAQKNLVNAARLLGATHVNCEWFNLLRTSNERGMRQNALVEVQANLEPVTFQAAWTEGTAMSLKNAIEFAKKYLET